MLEVKAIMTVIPKDPAILLSYVNTQLRDYYSSFPEFCAASGADGEEIEARLEAIDYRYDREKNQFI